LSVPQSNNEMKQHIEDIAPAVNAPPAEAGGFE
jgi:hypothetical protein